MIFLLGPQVSESNSFEQRVHGHDPLKIRTLVVSRRIKRVVARKVDDFSVIPFVIELYHNSLTDQLGDHYIAVSRVLTRKENNTVTLADVGFH